MSREADRLDELSVLLDVIGAAMSNAWAGSAADAAGSVLMRLRHASRALAEQSRQLGTVVLQGAARLERAQELARLASVDGTDAQSLIQASEELTGDARSHVSAGVSEFVDRLRSVSRLVGADLGAHPAWRDMSAVHAADALERRLATGAGEIPERVAAWWASLPLWRRQELWQDAPAWLGRLEGLPSVVRDRANQRRLARERAQTVRDLRAALQSRPPDLMQRLSRLNDRLARLELIRGQVIGHPDRLLLALDAEHGRAVVSVGDPDRATHVALLVPGASTTITDDLHSLVRRADDLRRTASSVAVGSVAAVAWLGYATPSGIDIASTKPAAAGAAALRNELDGLRASARAAGRDVHVTVVGHSYGSLVAGRALRDADHGVDDLVLLGSPGTGVDDADEIRLDNGAVYVAEADRDWIAGLGYFGADPGDRSFGAIRLGTDGEGHLDGVRGHSHYLDRGTESQRNVAAVVAGVPERVTTDP